MLIGRDHNPTLTKISKWNMNWVIAITVLTSLVFNIGHVFQYTLNDGRTYIRDFGAAYYFFYDTYPILNQLNFNDLFQLPLSLYLLVYFFINSISFWILNTLVEVVMIRKLHAELADKKKRRDGMNHTTIVAAQTLSVGTSFRKSRKQRVEAGTERRAILMVVISALLNFLLRLPELFVVFSTSTVFGAQVTYFFNPLPSFSLFLADFAYFCYILTFTTNFFIIYLFNQKFKQTFAVYTHAKQKS
jgi:hypothetical protein